MGCRADGSECFCSLRAPTLPPGRVVGKGRQHGAREHPDLGLHHRPMADPVALVGRTRFPTTRRRTGRFQVPRTPRSATSPRPGHGACAYARSSPPAVAQTPPGGVHGVDAPRTAVEEIDEIWATSPNRNETRPRGMRIASQRNSEADPFGRRPQGCRPHDHHSGFWYQPLTKDATVCLRQVIQPSVEEDSRWDSTTPSRSERPVQLRRSRRTYKTPSKPCWTPWTPHAPTSTRPTSLGGGPRARHRPGRSAAGRPGAPASPTRPHPRPHLRLRPHPDGHSRWGAARDSRAWIRVVARMLYRPSSWSRCGPVAYAEPTPRGMSRWSRCGREARV